MLYTTYRMFTLHHFIDTSLTIKYDFAVMTVTPHKKERAIFPMTLISSLSLSAKTDFSLALTLRHTHHMSTIALL